MRTKCLPIVLPPALYAQLEERAVRAERDPLQEARWILKRVLGKKTAVQGCNLDGGETVNGEPAYDPRSSSA